MALKISGISDPRTMHHISQDINSLTAQWWVWVWCSYWGIVVTYRTCRIVWLCVSFIQSQTFCVTNRQQSWTKW